MDHRQGHVPPAPLLWRSSAFPRWRRCSRVGWTRFPPSLAATDRDHSLGVPVSLALVVNGTDVLAYELQSITNIRHPRPSVLLPLEPQSHKQKYIFRLYSFMCHKVFTLISGSQSTEETPVILFSPKNRILLAWTKNVHDSALRITEKFLRPRGYPPTFKRTVDESVVLLRMTGCGRIRPTNGNSETVVHLQSQSQTKRPSSLCLLQTATPWKATSAL